MNSSLDSITVVLSHPRHPGNIGATARAMKTMGLSKLTLVNPLAHPHPDSHARAVGADDVLDQAKVVSSLDQALVGMTLVGAATARRRGLSGEPMWARDAAARLSSAARLGPVALVFGNETSGLSNAELDLCHFPVMIPVVEAYQSLNLAAAVQVLCYELRLSTEEIGEPPAVGDAGLPATHDQVERLIDHLERAMTSSGFLDPSSPKRLVPRLRRLFYRSRLEQEEVAILRGILTSFEKEL